MEGHPLCAKVKPKFSNSFHKFSFYIDISKLGVFPLVHISVPAEEWGSPEAARALGSGRECSGASGREGSGPSGRQRHPVGCLRLRFVITS